MAALVPRPPALRYWMTRDSAPDGSLMNWVALWTVRPVRVACGSGHFWYDPDARGQLTGWVESCWSVDASRRFGTVPDDDRQVITFERDAPLATAAA
jgi:hypothetical protein